MSRDRLIALPPCFLISAATSSSGPEPAASENDGRSFPRQQNGGFPADAGSCARDECYFPVDQTHHFSYSAAAGVERV